MLVAIRRIPPHVPHLQLDIPSAPMATAHMPHVTRTLRAKTLRTTPAEGYYLVGLKFSRPLLLAARPVRRKKAISAV